MKQSIVHVALIVRDYDEAIEFYTKKLNFTLVEDTYQPEQDKRWVVVAPPGASGTTLLLAKASTAEQDSFVGNQTGGRVFLFLSTDDFWRDYNKMSALGVTFVREPKSESYGTVAVFKDLYGTLWDLLEFRTGHSSEGSRTEPPADIDRPGFKSRVAADPPRSGTGGEEPVSESEAAIRIRQASAADVDVILHHRRSMFADMGEGEEMERDAMAAIARPFIEAALEQMRLGLK